MIGLREYALIAVVAALGLLGWRWWHLEGEVRAQAATLDGYGEAEARYGAAAGRRAPGARTGGAET
jgi:predicted negative regulator of RcsB-dependent stress response